MNCILGKTYYMLSRHQEIINQNIVEISASADKYPGVVILHDLRDWSVAWMSKSGLNGLDISLEDVTSLTMQEYHARFFNEEDSKDYASKIIRLMEENNLEETLSFFQQVRINSVSDWTWHMTSMKILAHDPNGAPLMTITVAFPIDALHRMTNKASRLLAENNFLRKNMALFSTLSRRERDILKYLALGKSSPEAAEDMFLSALTVETHRKNIKRKLQTNSYFDLCEYARAFDLV